MVTKKLTTIWRVTRAKQAHVVFQEYSGGPALSIGFGRGSLKDLVLLSKELKLSYDAFLTMLNESAANAGELHALKEIREAVDVIEESNNGRN